MPRISSNCSAAQSSCQPVATLHPCRTLAHTSARQIRQELSHSWKSTNWLGLSRHACKDLQFRGGSRILQLGGGGGAAGGG